MRPIIGGHVPPARVIGRDSFIEKMWNTLENQSIVLVSERRIGKTSVLWKMYKEPRQGWYPIYMAIQGVRSPMAFISKIVDAVSPALSQKGRLFSCLRQLYDEIAEGQFGDWSLPKLQDHWKRLLHATLNDIRENLDECVVFLWDELPLMLANIKDDLEAAVAMELLDTLRDYRMEDDSGKLRMVYTGSIGLHLVVSELVHRGYRNDPTNDMVTYSLEGLDPEDAQRLACQGLEGLVEGGEIELGDSLDEIAAAIAEAADGLPYYINYTVVRLADMGCAVKLTDVESALDSLVLDPEDTAHFEHYSERIEAYYVFEEQAQEIAYAILKTLCQSNQPMDEQDIWNRAASQIELTDRNLFQKILTLLVRDHYLDRKHEENQRFYGFKYNIVRRWWLKNRG